MSSSSSSSQRKKHPQYRCGATGSSVSSPLARSPGFNKQPQQFHSKPFNSSSSLAQHVERCSSMSSVDSGTGGGLSAGVNESCSSKRDQACQTMFSFPPDVDLTQIDALRQFILTDTEPVIENQSDKENLEHSPKRDRGNSKILR